MKSTKELYLISPQQLRKLPYEEALKQKIRGAEEAKSLYRSNANKEIKFSKEFNKQWDLYKASDKAKAHTQGLLKELNG